MSVLSHRYGFNIFALCALCAAASDLPQEVRVICETTAGNLNIKLVPSWSPLGSARFVNLVEAGFFTDIALYRSVPGFLVQFGISDDKAMNKRFSSTIQDDPNLGTPVNKGYLSFAGSGSNSRTTQLFFAFSDQPGLGKSPWETSIGYLEDFETLDKINKEYGDMPPWGRGPEPGRLAHEGNKYIHENFPRIDFIKTCRLVSKTPHSGL